MKFLSSLSVLLFSINLLFGQAKSVDELAPELLNWYNLDLENDGVLGSSVEKAYDSLIDESIESKEVIVAVLDGGVDIDHEDLKGKIWVNEDEIPNNGIDDDQNGYIDDIHGWNFIGSSDGKSILYENFEYVRIKRSNQTNDPLLEEANKRYKKEIEKREKEKNNIAKFEKIYFGYKQIIKEETGKDVKSAEDLKSINSNNPQVQKAVQFLTERYGMGFTEEGLERLIHRNEIFLDYYLNIEFEPRLSVGDDPTDINDRAYGNPDVKGPRPDHGTLVAGIIAANRNNDIGINGVATNVKIMCIRSTPDGDERDKDVALAIRYAVDNGADIVNMSFGKEFSPQKEFVDEAIKYAEEKGVLLIHSAGNSGNNIDELEAFPSDRLNDGSQPSNFLSIGASSSTLNTDVAAIFSNYGEETVDLFAPGVSIISTDSSSTYSVHSGTSFAAPVVSGIAALLLAYYPKLQPQEVIDILMSSSYTFKKPKKVLQPSLSGEKRKKEKFRRLSKSGGIANAYKALLEAERRSKL